MSELLYFIAGAAGLALLYFGAEWLVKGGSAIAERCRVPPLVIGLTLVAFGTSAPELFVSADAAIEGMGDMAAGNVIGSNICNIVLILGLSALIAPLGVNPALFRRDVPLMLIASIAVSVLCGYLGGIGRIAGAVLLCGLLLNTFLGIRDGLREEQSPRDTKNTMSGITSTVAVVAGLAALVAGSKLLLKSAVFLATQLGIPDSVVALTIVAVGTSLPELATSVVAAAKGERDIAVGNVIGSNVFNLLGIMGISALLAPIQCPGIDLVDLSMMIFTAAILWPMMKTGHIISRAEGCVLLSIYIGYTTWLVISI